MFENKGGLSMALREVFNPVDEGIELDSVYQLKNIAKGFYYRKNKLAKDLVDTLDTMQTQRPQVMEMKK